jgi:hypothetical protein
MHNLEDINGATAARKFAIDYHALRRHWRNHVSAEARAAYMAGAGAAKDQLEEIVADESLALIASAKVEWHPGELYPRVGFIVSNLARSPEGIVAFYNQRGTCEQWIKEGKNAIKWTRLSCRTFAANAVCLPPHALAYNLGNFVRTRAMPKTAHPSSLTSLREKLIKIGAKITRTAAK